MPALTGEKAFWGDPDYGGLAKMACHPSLVDEESEQYRPFDGKLFVFNTCWRFVRTAPVLPRDEVDADDVDGAEDRVGAWDSEFGTREGGSAATPCVASLWNTRYRNHD